jgi:hypothetical protein
MPTICSSENRPFLMAPSLSSRATLSSFRWSEKARAGHEGLVGIAVFMGAEGDPRRAIVQSAGHAYRLLARRLDEEFNRHGELQQLMLRYPQALIT